MKTRHSGPAVKIAASAYWYPLGTSAPLAASTSSGSRSEAKRQSSASAVVVPSTRLRPERQNVRHQLDATSFMPLSTT